MIKGCWFSMGVAFFFCRRTLVLPTDIGR